MDCLRGARKSQGVTQLLKRHIWALPHQAFELLLMQRRYLRLPAGMAVARGDIAGRPPLLQELFHHAQGDVVPLSDLLASCISPVICSNNPSAQILRKCSHA